MVASLIPELSLARRWASFFASLGLSLRSRSRRGGKVEPFGRSDSTGVDSSVVSSSNCVDSVDTVVTVVLDVVLVV